MAQSADAQIFNGHGQIKFVKKLLRQAEIIVLTGVHQLVIQICAFCQGLAQQCRLDELGARADNGEK